jgi:hypothetical protein
MKFVFDGEYCQFRGWVFAHRKPVNVTDRGTIEALKRNPNFRKVEDEEEKQAPAAAPVLTPRKTLSLGKRK